MKPIIISLDDVVQEIKAERRYAAIKWPRGESETLPQNEHSFGEWILYGDQYMAEARQLLAHEPGNVQARTKLLKAVQLYIWALQNNRSLAETHAETLYDDPV